MTSPRGRRLLTDAEIEIWLRVTQTIAARPGASLPDKKPVTQTAAQPEAPVPVPQTQKHRPIALPSYTPPVPAPKPKAPPLAPFEKRYRQKVTHGRVEIEGVIDLHGMTQPEAHAALNGFLRSAHRGGARLVLVVTGKGRTRTLFGQTYEAEPGVLRRAVPTWLRASEMRAIVMGFEEAGVPHGGMGALYVRLRRRGEG